MPVHRALLLLPLLIFYSEITSAQVLVANLEVKTTHLTLQDLRALIGMRWSYWPDGSPAVIYTLPAASTLHKEFCREYLKIFPYQLQRAWDRLVYSGIGQAPLQLNSVQEMKMRIENTPGAIGYLPKELVDNSVQVIEILPTK